MKGIYRPFQGALQRLTSNAGNKLFVRGGARGKVVPHKPGTPAPAPEPKP